jgi:peptide/nickel transport system substrate-binding protein
MASLEAGSKLSNPSGEEHAMKTSPGVSRWLRAALTIVVSALLLTALGSPAMAKSNSHIEKNGTLTIGIPDSPEELDPTTEASAIGHWVFANMCYALYTWNTSLTVVPLLTTALPTITDGGLRYTIHLRPGQVFQDGTPLTAAAVKESLERMKTLPASAEAPNLTSVTSISVVNKLTVQLNLSQPDAPLTSILADRAGIPMSPKALASEGTNFGLHPVCVGPFTFQSRPSIDTINLVRSKHFSGPKPKIAKITYQVIIDASTCYANLLSGTINIAECLAPNDVDLLKSNPAYRTGNVLTEGVEMLTLNVGNINGYDKPYGVANNPLAQHPILRKALELSLNRAAINKTVYDGNDKPACSPISPSNKTYYTNIKCTPHNVAEAKQLVAESGVPTPIKLTLLVATGAQYVLAGQVIAAQAKQAGFDITVEPLGGDEAVVQAEAGGSFEMYQDQWSGRSDPDQDLSNWYTAGSPLNYSGVDDPKLNAMLAAARSTTSVPVRKQDYTKIINYLNNKLSTIYLNYESDQIAYPKQVSGIVFIHNGNLLLNKTTISS